MPDVLVQVRTKSLTSALFWIREPFAVVKYNGVLYLEKNTIRFRILIVDDDTIFGENLRELLVDLDYSVEFVNSGTEAVKRLLKEKFDVVLTDLKMNGMNGFEVIREIKSRKPTIKIILMTGYGDSCTRTEALECGACHYITKPFMKKDILEILEQVS